MSLMTSMNIYSSTNDYLRSYDVRMERLVIDSSKYIISNPDEPTLDLTRFKYLKTFEIKNNPFITHIVIAEKSTPYLLHFDIENCPNLILIPANITSLYIRSNCKINEILENLSYNNVIRSLTISRIDVDYINVNSFPSLNFIRIECSIVPIIRLSELSESFNIEIYKCVIFKITHDDPKPNLTINVQFYTYNSCTILPDHVHKLHLWLNPHSPLGEQCKNIHFPKKLKSLEIKNATNTGFLKYLPESVKKIAMCRCTVDMDLLSVNVQEIDCSSCIFENGALNNLPRSIKRCSFYNCEMKNMGTFPQSLESIKITECNINEIKVAYGATKLNCLSNHITNIDNLPDSIVDLNCSYNIIGPIRRLPKQLETFECNSCDVTEICELPNTLKKCNLRNNYLTKVPKRPSFFCEMDYNVKLSCENTTVIDKLCYLGNRYRITIADFPDTPITASLTLLLSPVLLISVPIVITTSRVTGYNII